MSIFVSTNSHNWTLGTITHSSGVMYEHRTLHLPDPLPFAPLVVLLAVPLWLFYLERSGKGSGALAPLGSSFGW